MEVLHTIICNQDDLFTHDNKLERIARSCNARYFPREIEYGILPAIVKDFFEVQVQSKVYARMIIFTNEIERTLYLQGLARPEPVDYKPLILKTK